MKTFVEELQEKYYCKCTRKDVIDYIKEKIESDVSHSGFTNLGWLISMENTRLPRWYNDKSNQWSTHFILPYSPYYTEDDINLWFEKSGFALSVVDGKKIWKMPDIVKKKVPNLEHFEDTYLYRIERDYSNPEEKLVHILANACHDEGNRTYITDYTFLQIPLKEFVKRYNDKENSFNDWLEIEYLESVKQYEEDYDTPEEYMEAIATYNALSGKPKPLQFGQLTENTRDGWYYHDNTIK